MIDVNLVAKYFIYKSIPCTSENITNLKLQKLLYFAQGYYLKENGRDNPLFEEKIEAWAHGPVVPRVYRNYSNYKFMEISKQGTEDINKDIDPDYSKFLDKVWEHFKSYNGKELENMTHEEGPWKVIRGELPSFISTNTTIEKKDIYDFFKDQTAI
jgi:uncharacterized phage-associated protein